MAETKARQRKALARGLALGALMANVKQVNGNASTLQFAFRRATRGWAYWPESSAVEVGPAHDDIFHVLGDAARRPVELVGWQGEWPYVPVLDCDWAADELADIIHEQIPAEAWEELVRAWLGPRSVG